MIVLMMFAIAVTVLLAVFIALTAVTDDLGRRSAENKFYGFFENLDHKDITINSLTLHEVKQLNNNKDPLRDFIDEYGRPFGREINRRYQDSIKQHVTDRLTASTYFRFTVQFGVSELSWVLEPVSGEVVPNGFKFDGDDPYYILQSEAMLNEILRVSQEAYTMKKLSI